MPETQQEVALAYLRKQGRSLDLSAMRENLLAGGYDPAVVEQACLLYTNEYFAGKHHPTGCWRTVLGVSAALVLGAVALLVLLLAVCGGLDNEGTRPFLIVTGVLVVLAVAAVCYSFFGRQK